MKSVLKKLRSCYHGSLCKLYFTCSSSLHIVGCVTVAALLLTVTATTVHAQATGIGGGFTSGYTGAKFSTVCNIILAMHSRDYGALLTSVAGLGALVASAMGGFKMAWSCLVVAIGSFILQSYQELWFFGTCRGS